MTYILFGDPATKLIIPENDQPMRFICRSLLTPQNSAIRFALNFGVDQECTFTTGVGNEQIDP